MQLNANCRLEISKQQLILADADMPISLSFAECAILHCLYQHHGKVVAKDTLQQAGWPGRVVAASSLMQCISQLRKKLESEPDIELTTIPRHGYALHLKNIPPHTTADTSALASDDNPVSPVSPGSWRSRPKAGAWLLMSWLVSLLLLIAAWLYYPRVAQAPQWHISSQHIQINQAPSDIQLYLTPDVSAPSASQLQAIVDKHITPEPGLASPFNNYQGFALLDENNQSIALCPDYADNQCPGNKLINISSDAQQGSHIRLSDFLTTKIRLEQKTYNKLLLSDVPRSRGDLHEEVYHADLYFKVHDDLLVRSDFRISLVHLEANSGLFYYAACITDENCASSPIRFEVRGYFRQSQQQWQGKPVDVFTIDIDKTELNSPNTLSATATGLYMTLRKQHLTQKNMTFYRLYQDNGTAVWVVPLQQNNMVWMQRKALSY